MTDRSKTNQELIKENALVKQKILELEQAESERIRMEEAYKDSELKYRSLIEHSSDVVFCVDQNGEYKFVNEVFASTFGKTPDYFLGKTFWNIYPKEHADQRQATSIKVFETGESQSVEVVVPLPDRTLYFIAKANPVRDETGKVVLNLTHAIDITERKRMEEALRGSEERYRILFEGINDAVFVHDLGEKGLPGRFLQVNDVACRRLGYTSEELLCLTPRDITTPEEYKRFSEKRFILASHGNIVAETIHVTKDGRKIPVESNIRRFQYFDKQVALSISRDITDRKRAEEALLSESEFNGLVIENAGQGICVCHEIKEFPYVFFTVWNECMTLLTGYSMAEINRLGWYQSMYPDPVVQERAIMRMRDMRVGDDIQGEEWEITRADGQKRQLIITTRLHTGRNGELFVLGVMNDNTDRKRAEEEKRLLEERLQHADKMEAIGTLAGGIAHDFNNLLMGIQGYASLMLLDLDPSHPHYERLKRIEEQVQSGADLTRQLLGFARGGRYEVKPTDMNDILEKSSAMFGRTKKEISIRRKYGKDLWNVEMDRGQMEQVFVNLYVNAWQAMPGGGEIYLETENVLFDNAQAIYYSVRPGKYVKITVTDTGTGMDEKTRERIFDPFFTTKAMGRGTGLGLATVYGIIKGHKGTIHVYSEPGHGTTFNIYLPSSEKKVVKEKTATGTIARGTETLLLVDDEKMVLEVSKELLESIGYQVYPAGSGQEALAVYMEKMKEIDLVILDMIMPGISGGETFDRLREINPGIKVLLSSGYSLIGEAKTILDRGCNGFIQKPFQMEKLCGKVRDILDQNSAYH